MGQAFTHPFASSNRTLDAVHSWLLDHDDQMLSGAIPGCQDQHGHRPIPQVASIQVASEIGVLPLRPEDLFVHHSGSGKKIQAPLQNRQVSYLSSDNRSAPIASIRESRVGGKLYVFGDSLCTSTVNTSAGIAFAHEDNLTNQPLTGGMTC